MIFGRLLFLFTVIPVVELFLLIKVGQVIGALWTVAIVVGTGVLGAYLARRQGWSVWREIQIELQLGRFPANQMVDGLLLLIAGAFLITPGILTDLCGFALLVPVTRAPIRMWLSRIFRRMIDEGNVTFRAE